MVVRIWSSVKSLHYVRCLCLTLFPHRTEFPPQKNPAAGYCSTNSVATRSSHPSTKLLVAGVWVRSLIWLLLPAWLMIMMMATMVILTGNLIHLINKIKTPNLGGRDELSRVAMAWGKTTTKWKTQQIRNHWIAVFPDIHIARWFCKCTFLYLIAVQCTFHACINKDTYNL